MAGDERGESRLRMFADVKAKQLGVTGVGHALQYRRSVQESDTKSVVFPRSDETRLDFKDFGGLATHDTDTDRSRHRISGGIDNREGKAA